MTTTQRKPRPKPITVPESAVRTAEQILAQVEIIAGRVWATCDNCGGTGTYPSSMTPAGMCRFYCWASGKDPISDQGIPKRADDPTYGKRCYGTTAEYVKREQAADRRDYRATVRSNERYAAFEARRTARLASDQPQAVRDLLRAFGWQIAELPDPTTVDPRGAAGPALDLLNRWLGGADLTEKQEAFSAGLVEQEARWLDRLWSDTHSEWIGKIGERVTVRATLERRQRINSSWGQSSLYIFRTDTGACLKTFSSGLSLVHLRDGERTELTGTVKEHSEFRGRRETVLTRATCPQPPRT